MYHARYEKPSKNHSLFVAKKGGNVFPIWNSGTTLGEEVLLDRPYHNKRELKQPRRRRLQKPQKFAYLTMKNSNWQ